MVRPSASALASPPDGDLTIDAQALVRGHADGLTLDEGAVVLDGGIASHDSPDPTVFGMAESDVRSLRGPSRLLSLDLDAYVPSGTAVESYVRGDRNGRWTEWLTAADLSDLEGASRIQTRLILTSSPGGPSPRVRAIRAGIESVTDVHAAQLPALSPPTVTLMATREGMIGGHTANGHLIADHDNFVALPSKRALNAAGGTDYTVQITYHGKTVVAPVWDIGPWNQADDYWNDSRERFPDLPRWTSEAEAAFFNGYNGGRDSSGRLITYPNSIDLADGTFLDDLGMTQNDWVDVTFLWLNAQSPPHRPTPSVTPKTAPPTAPTRSSSNAPSRAAGYAAPLASSPLFLPLLSYDPSGWMSSWTIQNPLSAAVSGAVDLFDANGNQAGSVPFNLQPWGSDTFSVGDALGSATGSFIGSGVVHGSGPLVAVVMDDRAGVDRMSYEAISAGSATLAAPMVVKDHEGWSSGIQVQNLSNGPTPVRVSYIPAGGGSAGPGDETFTIGPLASHTFYQPNNTSLPKGFVGSALIQALNGQAIAAVVAETSATGGAMAYPALPNGSDSLFAPVVYKRYNGWDSGIQIQNLNPAPTRALITYQSAGSAAVVATSTVMIPGGGSATVYQPAEPQLSDGFVGSARLIGDPGSRLAGVVSEVQTGGQAAMDYTMGRALAPSAIAPLLTKGTDGWNVGIQVQLPGQAPSPIIVTFYDEDGDQVFAMQDTIEAGGNRTIYPPAIGEIPSGFRGSAIVQSGTGQPLSVVVNETAR